MNAQELLTRPHATLVERLRTRPTGDPYLHMMVHEAADEIERLRTAISIVREYPDFDSGGALPEMMDQVLRGLPAPMLDMLDLLGLGPNVQDVTNVTEHLPGST